MDDKDNGFRREKINSSFPQPQGLLATEAECAKGRTAPRVSLADIEAAILHRYDHTAFDMLQHVAIRADTINQLSLLSICIVVMKNGFTIIGKSAPASPENFDRELGQKLAYEDAVRQIWPLMGFALRDRLHREQEEEDGAVAEALPPVQEEPIYSGALDMATKVVSIGLTALPFRAHSVGSGKLPHPWMHESDTADGAILSFVRNMTDIRAGASTLYWGDRPRLFVRKGLKGERYIVRYSALAV